MLLKLVLVIDLLSISPQIRELCVCIDGLVFIHFSVFCPAAVHLSAGDPGWSFGVHLLPEGKV